MPHMKNNLSPHMETGQHSTPMENNPSSKPALDPRGNIHHWLCWSPLWVCCTILHSHVEQGNVTGFGYSAGKSQPWWHLPGNHLLPTAALTCPFRMSPEKPTRQTLLKPQYNRMPSPFKIKALIEFPLQKNADILKESKAVCFDLTEGSISTIHFENTLYWG